MSSYGSPSPQLGFHLPEVPSFRPRAPTRRAAAPSLLSLQLGKGSPTSSLQTEEYRSEVDYDSEDDYSDDDEGEEGVQYDGKAMCIPSPRCVAPARCSARENAWKGRLSASGGVWLGHSPR